MNKMINSNEINKFHHLNTLILILSSLSMISLFFIAWLPSYFGLTPSSEIILGPVSDGHCDPITQGIGLHCFGDYYFPLNFINDIYPWDTDGAPPYSAAALLVFSFFNKLSTIFNIGSIGLITYLIISPFTLLFMLVKSFRKFRYPVLYLVIIFTHIIASYPFLFAFDRGNSILLALPLLIFLFKSYQEKNYSKFLIFVILLSFIKIHFIIFLLILLTTRKIGKILLFGFVAIVANILPFVIYGNNFLHNLSSYLHEVLSFQEYTPPGLLNFNLSLPNSVAILERLFFDVDPVNITYLSSSVPIFCLILVCFYLWIYGSQFNDNHNFLILLLFVIIFPNVSYTYYLVLLLAFFIYAVISYLENVTQNQSSYQILLFLSYLTKRDRILVFTCYILLFIPWTIPWFVVLPENTILNQSELNSSLTRFPGQVVLIILFFSLLLRRVQKTDSRSL
jgi:hypothetical protein